MNNWTQESISFAQAMLDEGKTYYEVSRELERTFGFVVNPETVRMKLVRSKKPKLTQVEKLRNEGITKTLVLSDLHCPYNVETILEIVAEHAKVIDTLIIGGDVIDCFAISSFHPLAPKPLLTEMAYCHQLLKDIENITPDVKKILIKGNHELRFEKYMATNDSELNDMHSSNILYEICRGFEYHDKQNGRVVSYEPLDYEVVDNWFVQHNDMIVCHPLSFSRVPAKVAYNAVEYFVRNGMNFNACLVAHTHHYGACQNLGKTTVEIGCLCKPQDYAASGKLNYTPQDRGYHLAVFKDGEYCFNMSRQYLLDEQGR